MGYDIDDLDARFQMAVRASQDLQISLPCSASELQEVVDAVDQAKRALLFGPNALGDGLPDTKQKQLAPVDLIRHPELRAGSAPSSLYHL